MVENKLAPSILSIDFGHMERELKKAENAGAKMIHVDVMDGDFVPNISFGTPIMPISVTRPIRWLSMLRMMTPP